MEAPLHTSRKTLHLWGKVLVHFFVFFVTGFIAAFIPWDATTYILNRHFSINDHVIINGEIQNKAFERFLTNDKLSVNSNTNAIGLVIVITTTRPNDEFQLAKLTRLAHNLANVSPPLLWIVVEARDRSVLTTEMLRGTKIMYRHLMYKEDFTDPKLEMDYQRNIALRHIQRHRMPGFVHFGDPSVIYDLEFFEEIRKIKYEN